MTLLLREVLRDEFKAGSYEDPDDFVFGEVALLDGGGLSEIAGSVVGRFCEIPIDGEGTSAVLRGGVGRGGSGEGSEEEEGFHLGCPVRCLRDG